MKCDSFRLPVSVLAILGGMAFLAACENTPIRPAGAASANLAVDLKPGSSGETGLAREGGGMPEGIGRYAGRYYYIHEGSAVRMSQRQRFVQGYSYEGRGRIVSKSGHIVRLTDGEMVTFGGDRLPLPPGIAFP